MARYEITIRYCDLYGYSLEHQSKRCVAFAAGDSQTPENHNDGCRQRCDDLFLKTKELRFMEWLRTSKIFATRRREQLETDSGKRGPPLPAPQNAPDALEYGQGVLEDHGDDLDVTIDTLAAYGVPTTDAARACLSMTNRIKPTTFDEIDGRGQLTAKARLARRDVNLAGLRVVGLRTCKPDGSSGGISLPSHRQEVLDPIDKEQPDSILVGPPCTQLSTWQTSTTRRWIHFVSKSNFAAHAGI